MGLVLEEKPVFVIGPERSGTTMLMCMIGSHPRISVPEVTWFYPRFRPYLYTYGDIRQEANFHTLAEEMIFSLMVPFFGLRVNPRTVVSEVLAHVCERSFAGIFAAVIDWYRQTEGKPRWGEKTPANVFHIKAITEDFPNAQFIFIVRDGRDSSSEYLQGPFGPTNAFCAAETWKLWVNAAKPWRATLDSRQWLDVRYETLVREPERTLHRVCDFLGEDYSPSMLQFYKGTIAQRRGKIKDHSPLASPVSDRYIGIYKEILSLREQRIFAGVAGHELVEHGYQVEVEPVEVDQASAGWYRELDGRYRAARLDGSLRHHLWESYNDWLIDQREERRRKGIWSHSDRPAAFPIGDPNEELIMGMNAWRRWKEHFCIKRKYAI